MFAALGNFIKSNRKKNSLTQVQLAERIGVSNQMITLMEQGRRGGSRATLEKLADVFEVKVEELYQLRSKKTEEQEIEDVVAGPYIIEETDIADFMELIKSVHPAIRLRLLPEFKKRIIEVQKSFLKPYELKEVKRMVLDIKNYWLNLVQSKKEQLDFKPEPETEGYIYKDKRDVYFRMTFNAQSFDVFLHYNDKLSLADFEHWLGECSLYLLDEAKLPTMEVKAKVIHAVWFCPLLNTVDMYQHVINHGWLEQSPTFRDPKIEWFLRQHHFLEEAEEVSS
ncbi:helix-turn-helix transcriptional regulator [Bacillus tianshenii]|nr:helix-turn-helix transcriptional regulator [Bacillus tianshenii]